MSDTALNRFLSFGTDAARIAFVPDPPVPASGADVAYLWFTSDTLMLYAYDFGVADWVEAGGASIVFSGAQVQMSSNQSINDATGTTLTWATEIYDTDAFWSAGAPTDFVVPENGKYRVTLNARFAANTTGHRQAFIRYNGGGVAAQSTNAIASGGYETEINLSVEMDAVATQVFQAGALQNSGGALNVLAGVYTRFSISRIH